MSRLALYLLGSPRLERDGVALKFRYRKHLALLAYLAVAGPSPGGESHTRESLITLLWPELEPSRARAILRRDLSLLRKALGREWLVADRETVSLDPDTAPWVDVDQFRQRLAACKTHGHPPTEVCRECIPLLEEAAALYRDHFLAGFTLPDSAAFDDWQFFQTEGLKDELAGALVRLVTYHTSQGDFEAAISDARRWQALDPLHEPAHRHLMVLYAQSGQRSAALRQYETCRQTLADELGVEPAERTQETYQRLLKGELPVGPSAVEAILERELRTVGECPYRGLAPFREADAPFFFGREAFTERLAEAVRTRPMVAVIVGSSGSGKSSAVFAGLLPRLREQGNWLIAGLRPGGQPFHGLAAVLLPALEPELDKTDRLIETRKLAQALSEGDVPLSDVVEQVLAENAGATRLLLLIDQFEELYTLCPEPETRRDFVDALLAAVEAVEERRDSPFVLLLTMRADFMGQAVAHRPFADALQEAALIMGPMTREELRTAIEKPADKQGAALEAGLVERLLDDVGQEPGNLPLLEFALTLLWERLDYGWMTHKAYEEIGRVEGALARYAQQVYDELEEAEREGARRIFTQLVQPGEGTEDTRRVATRAELGDENWELVQHLADKRLVVTGRDPTTGSETVEVVHEALIQRWGQLRGWMEEDRAFRTWQERLRGVLSQWQTTGQDEGVLLRGAPLAEAEGWLEERGAEVSAGEKAFIETSVELREQQAAERAAQRQRELTQVSIGLASQALLELEGTSSERAVLLALEALENYPYTWQAERALGQAVLGSRVRLILQHEAEVNSVRWSPDGTRILTASDDSTAKVWDAVTGEELLMLSGHQDAVWSAEWSPAGDRIVTASTDGTAQVWDVSAALALREAEGLNTGAATGEQLLTLPCGRGLTAAVWSPTGELIVTGGHGVGGAVWDATTGEELATPSGRMNPSASLQKAEPWWSPDGSRIASASVCAVMVWDAATGERLLELSGHRGQVDQMAWSPDGSRIVSTSFDRTAKVWDASVSSPTYGEELLTLIGHTGEVYDVAWSPDGSRIVTGGGDNTARVWDASVSSPTYGEELLTLAGHGDYLVGVAWSPDGSHIVTWANDDRVRVWDGATGAEVLSPIAGLVHDVAWSPSGDRIVIAGADGVVRVWDLSPALLTVHGPEGMPTCVAEWSPEGNRIARGFPDGTIKVWDAATGEELLSISRHAVEVVGLDWCPAGDRIVTSGNDGTLRVWDADTGEGLLTLRGHSSTVYAVAWSPDGTRILTAGEEDRTVRIWDASTGTQHLVFIGHDDAIMGGGAAWSPDGKTVATASHDGSAKIWDAATGKVIRELFPEGSGLRVLGVGWSPDGKHIATSTADGIGQIWNARTGEQLATLAGLPGGAVGIHWSNTGERILIFYFASGIAIVWDVSAALGSNQSTRLGLDSVEGPRRDTATGFELLRYDVGHYLTARWSPDGKHSAIATTDGALRVFPAWQTTQELIDYAKECCVVREMTDAEREQFGLGPR